MTNACERRSRCAARVLAVFGGGSVHLLQLREKLVTALIGLVFLGSAALSCALVYTISVRGYLVVGPVLGNGAMGALGLWTFWHSRRSAGWTEPARSARRRDLALASDRGRRPTIWLVQVRL